MLGNDIVIEDIVKLTPAGYNPRITDPQRLAWLEMSLSYLGFVLPLYVVRGTGTLLSGHQRLLAARNLGATKVPVVYVDIPDKAQEMNMNVVFNRTTNDMKASDTSEDLQARFQQELENMTELMKRVSRKTPDTESFYPCLYQSELIDTDNYDNAGNGLFNREASSIARLVLALGVRMPVVMDADGKIVNGIHRYYAAMEAKGHNPNQANLYRTYPCVRVSNDEGVLTNLFTNMVSMSFDINGTYADKLRRGAFRRQNNKVENLTATLRFWADGKTKRNAEESLKDPVKFWTNFRSIHGGHILDFGAGQRRNDIILRKKGFDIVSFEPLPVPTDTDPEYNDGSDRSVPHLGLAKRVAQEFLDHLLQCQTKFDSIFLSSVLNSVPFYADRVKVLLVVHALCGYDTVLYGSVRGLSQNNIDDANAISSIGLKRKGDNVVITRRDRAKAFPLNYEENVVVAEVNINPKVQKYHSKKEITALLSKFFTDVRVWGTDSSALMLFRAAKPKRFNPAMLREAIELEFNMGVTPEGESIGMTDEFYNAFIAYRNK